MGRLGGGVGRRVVWAQRVVYFGLRRCPAAYQRQVLLAHGMPGEGVGQGPRGGGVQGHDEHAAGALVQPVHGVDVLADLVAQRLHHEARFARVQTCAVHQPARRLENGHHVRVLPQQAQRRVRGRQGLRPGVSWMVLRPEWGGSCCEVSQYTHRPRSHAPM